MIEDKWTVVLKGGEMKGMKREDGSGEVDSGLDGSGGDMTK